MDLPNRPMTAKEALSYFHFPKCNDCIHLTDDGDCPAFPERIPDDIFCDDVPHDHVRPDQVGDYVFTPIPEAEKA